MRQRSLYATLRCLLHPAELEQMEIFALQQCLIEGGATIVESTIALESSTVTHIICHPKAYRSFMELRNERFVALVRPEWVFRTFLLQQLLPVDRFSPNMALIFSTLTISACAMGKEDPRRVINSLITHFGGQIIDQNEFCGGATHILHLDDSIVDSNFVNEPGAEKLQTLCQLKFSKRDLVQGFDAWKLHLSTDSVKSTYKLPSCIIAYIGQNAGLDRQYHVKLKWIEECVMRRNRELEERFSPTAFEVARTALKSKPRSRKSCPEVQLEELNLGKFAQVYQLERTEHGIESSMVRKWSFEKLEALKKNLQGTIVLLAQHLAPLLREKLSDMLKLVNAKVANVPFGDSYQEIVSKVVTKASFVVCRYRGGFEYKEAVRQDKKVVSIYWVLAGLSQASNPSPYNEIIQRPVKYFGSINGMQSFVITLSGYSSHSSPTREELQIAIHATGACLLPVLSRAHSTHLICYEASGEKYKKALSWQLSNILSHEWVFTCLSEWEHVSELPFQIRNLKELSTGTDSMDNLKKDKKFEDCEDSVTDKTKRDVTSSMRRAKTASKGRFDVDDILSEIDKLPTPIDKNGSSNGRKLTPAISTELPNSIPSHAKEIVCTLFDTQTNRSGPSSIETNKNTVFDDGDEEDEVEREPATMATKTAKKAKDSLPLISVTSASNADDGSTVETAKNKEINQELKQIRGPVQTTKATKRKAGGSEELGSARSSRFLLKKQKKEQLAIKKIAVSKPQNKRVFLLTGDRHQAAEHTSIIHLLGGNVSKFGRVYDSNCTHIICSELKRTEKFVAGCAAGKWILKPSYLEASSVAGIFLDEIDFEWGCQKSDCQNIDTRIWPEVCGYWRKKRASGHPGAFSNWRFLVHAKCVPPRDMCERIILAGGGSVIPLTKSVDFNSLSKESTSEAPVVALVPPEEPLRDMWMKKFKMHDIECIKASFLIDCISKEPVTLLKRENYHII
ncbi:uncharacterized protein CCR75_006055 [Bremia lactucae]|uniref:BRCT domain-containing protein n=1 Tax=Bremia lactucae TaxID=4779 RepID=A0A976FER5_BRELC|nr:hypothetical protein CCR75_006055 [Bremia lactucae]